MYKGKHKFRFVSFTLTLILLFSILCAASFSVSVSAETIGIRAGETYYLRNVATGTYMDVYNSNVDIWQEVNAAYQDFTVVRNVSSQYPGSYYIKCVGKYVMSSADEKNVIVGDASTYDSKALWSIEKASHGDADIFSTRYPEFDTTGANAHVLDCVQNRMGYSGTSNINPSIDSVWEAIYATDILVCHTHGNTGGGGMIFYNRNGQQTGAFTGKEIDALPNNKLSSLRVFIACGCDTGNTSSKYGNVVSSAFYKGAHFAIGWTEDIPLYTSNHWLKNFFDKIGDKGATVKEARDHAEYWSSCGLIKFHGDISQQLSHIK